jgi:choline dehydrogenase
MRAFGAFDYIVVGAGSAGCVLANRLSASGRFRVLLLEAGPPDTNPWIHIPLGYGRLFRNASVNWLYETEPQAELNGRRIMQPRGKVLGGSSSINALIYVRGQREDFDGWRQLGAVGWGYDDVLPYFRKAENQVRGEDEFHGVGGPLPVSNQDTHPLCDAFIAASEQAGHPRNPDFNGVAQEGAGYFQTTSHAGRRASTAVAYLNPAKRRKNLAVVTRAHVARVVIEGGRATGVEWTKGGERFVAEARAEVVLASGAIGTPQILQLSGVGPGALLQAHGVPVVRDLPGVGENLQDHLQVRMVFRATGPITLNDALRGPWGKARAGLAYALMRRGPLTVGAGYAGGFFKTDPRLASPDIQVHFLTFSTDRMGDQLHTFSGFTASSCQLRPESRGFVRIRSADPFMHPAIDPQYLTAEADRRANVEGLKLLRRIMAGSAFGPLLAEEVEPGAAVTDDDGLLAYCRERATTIYHPTCTARMGDDPLAVVDWRLKARGIAGLRIADASIMPRLVSGNTNAAAIMIGEKAADMILEDASA